MSEQKSHKYEFVIEETEEDAREEEKHIKSHKSSFGINVIMMENVLFIKGGETQTLWFITTWVFFVAKSTLMYTFFLALVLQ